jgi:hypothetical protein
VGEGQKMHQETISKVEFEKCACNKMYALFKMPDIPVGDQGRSLIDTVLGMFSRYDASCF